MVATVFDLLEESHLFTRLLLKGVECSMLATLDSCFGILRETSCLSHLV